MSGSSSSFDPCAQCARNKHYKLWCYHMELGELSEPRFIYAAEAISFCTPWLLHIPLGPRTLISWNQTLTQFIQLFASSSKSVPQIVISPENTSTVAGSTTVLACVGYGSPSVTWSKDGAVLVNNSQVTIFEDQVTRGGFTFTKSVLQLCDTQEVNSGQYSCSIEDIQMNDSATFELSVLNWSVTPNVGMLWIFITRSIPTCIYE